MIKLNDASIRGALIDRLMKLNNAPRAVLEELHVHNGRAIADVVALHTEAHCYEIKGSTDKVERVQSQGNYYNKVFRRNNSKAKKSTRRKKMMTLTIAKQWG